MKIRVKTKTEMTAAELGSISFLPRLSAYDMGFCNCGQEDSPMGCHHDGKCKAHCICGRDDLNGRTCGYHQDPNNPPSVTTLKTLKKLGKTDV